jgi:peptidoglycan/xylan/chitin deacetylase (PgdA/CDA1 family)
MKHRIARYCLRVAASASARLGVLDAYSRARALTGCGALILNYHSVRPDDCPWLEVGISPEAFETQMARLHRVARVVPLEQLLDGLSQRQRLSPRLVSITFDDGYRDNYVYAYPILRKYEMPATILLTTGYCEGEGLWPFHKARFAIWSTAAVGFEVEGLGGYRLESLDDRVAAMRGVELALDSVPAKDKWKAVEALVAQLKVDPGPESVGRLALSWDEASEMSQNGVSFGSHSVTHSMLTKLSPEEAREEIVQSRRSIEDKLGLECGVFAYPDGDFDGSVAEVVRQAGFRCALTTKPGRVTGKSDAFALNRISASPDFSLFRLKTSVLYSDLVRSKCLGRRSAGGAAMCGGGGAWCNSTRTPVRRGSHR